MEQKVWFITGAGSGFGAILVDKLLKQNQKVVATSRKRESFAKIKNDNFLGLEITDLNSKEQLDKAIKEVLNKFQKIDILINNAGYGQAGVFEEVSPETIMRQFNVNLFGLMNVTRHILPIMRKQRSGRIINMSAVWGFTTAPGWGTYAATKFAVDGWSGALAGEVKPFGIYVTSLMPGAFRTAFLKQSLSTQDYVIDDYKEFDAELNAMENDEKTRGIEPDEAMDIVIKLALMSNPPVHTLLGQHAIDEAEKKDKMWEQVISEAKEINFGK